VIPDDVQALAVPVLAHRLLPAAAVQRRMPEQVIADLLQQLPLGKAALTTVDGEEREAS
jgi:MoxR-like ATPase